MEIPQIVPIQDIVIQSRIRKDLGDIPGLANSIKENGLIEPIVLTHDWIQAEKIEGQPYNEWGETYIKLVAGERRLTALKSLGIQVLTHGIEYVWRSELESDDPKKRLLFSAIEMEENVRRKDLSWQEQVEGKAKLLKIMQEIHGLPTQGRPSEAQKASNQPGFGVNKLSAMLGESKAQTSEDLELASLLEKVPSLKNEPTREDARRKFTSEAIKVLIAMKSTSKPIDESYATIYHGSFITNIHNIQNESIDLIYTDLPYGVNLSDMTMSGYSHSKGILGYSDERTEIVDNLGILMNESYRILKPDRFAVFFFGFNYYTELIKALENARFGFNKVPAIWYKKGGKAPTQDPLTRYGNIYDPIIVAYKGSPRFIRPGLPNVIEIPQDYNKMHKAQQPVELPKKFIEDMTLGDATVVDLMCGSGTTGVAALELGRKCILFEQDKAIYDYAKMRIEDTIKKIKGS